LILHRNAQPGDVRHEREADQFAAEFLMAAARIEPTLPRRIDSLGSSRCSPTRA